MMGSAPLVFALDLPTLEAARAMALKVRDSVGMVKVGLELFVEGGPAAVRLGQDAGLPVFLDLKLHDIPETVDRAVARACALGARVLTVHASGGPRMLQRAAERAEREGTGLRIAAVTVLTSLDKGDLASVGVAVADVESHVVRLAKLAWAEGVRTFVCSPHEASALRGALGPDATLVTPGVRSGAATAPGKDDQKRVMSAAEAIRAGADWVVVGRPIRDAADPAEAARALLREIASARA